MICVGSGAYAMYSFSPFVIRTSGSLPRRPTRMILETSEERKGVVEKACGGCEDGCVVKKKETNASKAAWVTEEREHVQVRRCHAV